MAQLFFEVLREYGPYLALLLQAVLLCRFLSRQNRDYPLAIVFTLLLFLLTLAGTFFTELLKFLPPGTAPSFLTTYSAADLFMHVLLLALMLQLIRNTLKSLELGTRIVIPLALISCLVGISAFQFFGGEVTKKVLYETRQVVSFWMVLLNLYWWTLLLRKRILDRRVLLLSAGIGLMMTGQVIGDGIQSMSEAKGLGALVSILVMYSTHFACLYAWYEAFSPSNAMSEVNSCNESLT